VPDRVEEAVDLQVLLFARGQILDVQSVEEVAVAEALGCNGIPEDGLVIFGELKAGVKGILTGGHTTFGWLSRRFAMIFEARSSSLRTRTYTCEPYLVR